MTTIEKCGENMEISEQAPAKINLGLDLLYRHHNGAEEWRMVLLAVGLVDTVRIQPDPTGRIQVTTNRDFLPVDQRNLAYRAAQLLQRRFDCRQGAKIEIIKRIPVSAGLGGGSADAAAVLRGLNRLWHLQLSLAELAQLGVELDADVPFCVYATPAVVSGQGERVEPLGLVPNFWLVLVKPQVSVSTTKLLAQVSLTQLTHHPDIAGICAGLRQGDWPMVARGMANSLEEVTSTQHPQLLVIKERMLRAGALAAQMSGTGPTMFALTAKQSQARRIYNAMRGFCEEVYLVQPLSLLPFPIKSERFSKK